MIAISKQRQLKNPRHRKLHERFCSMLPKIRTIASHACREEDPEKREEFMAEVVANAYCAFVRLAKQGRLDIVYATPLAKFAVRQVRAGRRVGTRLNIRDITSRHCQLKTGIAIERLDVRDKAIDQWQEVLVEDKHSTPADIAASRIDFASWLRSLSRKKRQIAKTLATGESTSGTARRHRVSPGRIPPMDSGQPSVIAGTLLDPLKNAAHRVFCSAAGLKWAAENFQQHFADAR